MKNHLSLILTIIITSLLASCASVEPQSPTSDDLPPQQAMPEQWQQEMKNRQQIQSWEIRGRLGVQTKDEGGSLDLIWKQSAEDYSIRLIAPMAAGNYHIQGADEFANIRYPDGSNKNIEDTEKIFLTSFQVDLPSSAIKDWVRGLPASELETEEIEWNDMGLIKRIKQSGWNVEMNKYTGTDIQLPHAIYISRDDDEDLDIRFLLRQWLIDN